LTLTQDSLSQLREDVNNAIVALNQQIQSLLSRSLDQEHASLIMNSVTRY